MRAKLVEVVYSLIATIYRLMNLRKRKIYVFTDSRGYNVLRKIGKDPFQSYIGRLIKSNKTEYFICPEKHTTILDFLVNIKKIDIKNYDVIIMHCGIVDFSPRPLSNLNFVLNSKSSNEYMMIARNQYGYYYENLSEVQYQGEKTQTLYAPEFLKEVLIPELKKIGNLIWINSNHFVPGWEGNFKKGRPRSIEQTVSYFDSIMCKNLRNIVNLKKWTYDEVKEFTIDNIHFTSKGFARVYEYLDNLIEKISYEHQK